MDYNWTEHEDDDLKKTLADSIITINHRDSYHIEVQMYPDSRIVMRVFEYGFRHALTSQSDMEVLNFPDPLILYLYEDGSGAETQRLLVNFGTQGSFEYCVPTYRYLRMGREELERRKLIVLIPFQLLRLRKAIERERTEENLKALKRLVQDDIIGVINDNVAAGNISPMEGQTLKQMTLWLYRHVYSGYAELEREGVNTMVEEGLILDMDIIVMQERKKAQKEAREWAQKEAREWARREVQKEAREAAKKEAQEWAREQVGELKARKDSIISEKNAAISERDAAIKGMLAKLRSLGFSDEEILKCSGLTPEQLQKLETDAG